ncbi:MAG: sugar-transfer associated ATP-grasp domain-containing protein [Gemmatimonadaceae bacterium]
MAIDRSRYEIRLSGSRWDHLAFRAEHWLLSPGRSDTARLRGYMRVKEWRDCRGAGERLHAIKVAAKLPLRAFRESRLAVARHGEAAARDHGVSRRRQLLHLWWLWTRHGIHPEVYYTYRLYRPGQLRRAPAFFQGKEDRFYRMVNLLTAADEAEMLADKARFERWLAERRLPTISTAMELADGNVVTTLDPAGRLPRRDLFSKPIDAVAGIGTQRWTFDGEGWIGEDGCRRSEAALMEELRKLSLSRGMLIQERLRNHPSLAPIAPAALSTVRVVTLRGLDGVVRVVMTVCKIPAGGAPTDHMRLGGLAAPIDLATGRLGPAIRKSETSFVETCSHHPDTGALIEGFQLPDWPAVIGLAVRAHEALEQLVCIGWDIAILADGPIIIEGNDNPGHASFQLPTGVAVGETPIVATLRTHLQTSFARLVSARHTGGAMALSPSAAPGPHG